MRHSVAQRPAWQAYERKYPGYPLYKSESPSRPRMRGMNKHNSPELDHVVPISKYASNGCGLRAPCHARRALRRVRLP
jgi:hypothetical protein